LRKLTSPTFKPEDVYDACHDGLQDSILKGKYSTDRSIFLSSVLIYEGQSKGMTLSSVPSGLPTGLRSVKDELVKMYDEGLVKRKAGRAYYDKLKSSCIAPCPLCGFGPIDTLDHYLPKANYPIYSVLPINLVPSCFQCNKGKGSGKLNMPEDQALHPYFDDEKFFSEQWISARVHHTSPVMVEFYVNPPHHWDSVSKARVTKHFDDFKLSTRFSEVASSAVTTMCDHRKEILQHVTADEFSK
jgi:hypothetical protein